jgi:hypothetical protein
METTRFSLKMTAQDLIDQSGEYVRAEDARALEKKLDDCNENYLNAYGDWAKSCERVETLEAEVARLKGVVKAQAETIRLMANKQAAMADRARETRAQLAELREAVAQDVMAGFELSTKLQRLAGVKP